MDAEAEAVRARSDSLAAVPGAPGSLTPADSAWLATAPARYDSLRAERAALAPGPRRWSTGTALILAGSLLGVALLIDALNPAD